MSIQTTEVIVYPPSAVTFTVPGLAKTKGSMSTYSKAAKSGLRENVKGSAQWRMMVAERARAAMAGRPSMSSGGVFVYATFHLAGDPTATRSGDVDKLLRNVLDALSSCTAACGSGTCGKHAGVYGDDVQVLLAVTQKCAADAGGPRCDVMVGWYAGTP